MGNILVYLQQDDNGITKASKAAINAATQFKSSASKGELIGLVLGKNAKSAAENAAKLGLSKVIFSEDVSVENYLAIPYTDAILKACNANNCDTVMAAATTTGKDCLPRVSVGLDAGQASDIIGVESDGKLIRPMYAGDVIAKVELLTEKKVISVRPTAFDPIQESGSGSVEELSGPFGTEKNGELVNFEISGGDRPELTEAEIVVSGGRAMQSEENFEKYIFPLADALGAAVGASRAAVDSGYAPNDWQVGQTGKVVAPNLYIAIGISGAIQHLAGMKDSKVIVAINKDPEAPIYEIADYGLVADLYQVVPELTEAVKSLK